MRRETRLRFFLQNPKALALVFFFSSRKLFVKKQVRRVMMKSQNFFFLHACMVTFFAQNPKTPKSSQAANARSKRKNTKKNLNG